MIHVVIEFWNKLILKKIFKVCSQSSNFLLKYDTELKIIYTEHNHTTNNTQYNIQKL